MNLLVLICFLVWLYVLSVFIRGKLHFAQFVWGSVGVFVFMVIWLRPLVIAPLMKLVCSASGLLGDLTGTYESYAQYNILFIGHESDAISLMIDYECSGIIEMMAFVSMLLFFRVYDVGQRCVLSLLGCLIIFFANVFRIFVICEIVYLFGNDVYYIAHTIVGRIVFYCISVLLYYYVFTKPQIVKQMIGGVRYAENMDIPVK